ncbi:MAG: molybdopterin molybdotransferase MoeA [Gammaproteobacteria bacterium]|nr:molybdopterin molybdotransferase MoeA [Gammaproteobacteria bacterium]MDH3446653.1 molybdopterin molybdotransferase MoeA [Gammaproteobacteria bacterium]
MSEKITPVPSCADPSDPASISLSEALARIEARVLPVHACERLPIRECLGRVNNEAVKSPHNVPPSPNSAMDGFAIAIASLRPDGITELEEIGTAYAGLPFAGSCGKGQCVRIMTGALIPDGADAVIMQEQAEVDAAGKIRIDSDHRSGENIRQAGEDVRQGETVIEAGVRLNPADLGVLASLGLSQLQVKRKPVVAFFSTGDELVAVGESLQPGKIYDSNRYSLHGMLSRLAVDIIDLGVVRDNPESMRDALTRAASQADLIISTGGVSVGEADYVKPALEELGTTEFWKIAIKPGRPLTFGQIGASIFMGLPGNPVAVMVTFSQFVEPAIEVLSGARLRPPALFRARALDAMRKKPGRYEFQRGIATLAEDGHWQVRKTGKQGSGILTSMSRANCFIVLPDDNAGVEPGDEVSIQFFDWSR